MRNVMTAIQNTFERGCVFFFLIPLIGMLCIIYFLITAIFKLTTTEHFILAGVMFVVLLILLGLIAWRVSDLRKGVEFQSKE